VDLGEKLKIARSANHFKSDLSAKMCVIAMTNPAIYRREHNALIFPGFQPLLVFSRFSGLKPLNKAAP
jgi:hypothetical protein